MDAGQRVGDDGSDEIPDGCLTFDEFMALEAVLPEYTIVIRGVGYVEAGDGAQRAAGGLADAVRSRGRGWCRVRSLVRSDGEPRMFVELDESAARQITCDVLAAARRDERRRRRRPRG